jgi:predicted  nucleic acid-binding Zn-ribbon protein
LSLNLEVQILGEYKNLTKATKGATKQLNSLKKSTQSISRGINAALATIGVGISFRAITNSISSLTKAAVEDVQAQTLLAQQLRNTVGASDAVVASVEEQISQVQTATGVVDDELRPAYAKLVRSTKDTARAFRLLNLATDISAQTGKSLDSVSTALSRALNGNTASLVKLIPSIKNSTDFVADLEKQFKGAAAAANNLDPYNRLKIAFDEVKETIGAAFLPALGSIATFIDDNLPKIDALADAINTRVKQAFENAGGAAVNFGAQVTKGIEALTEVVSGNISEDNPLKPFIDAFSDVKVFIEGLIEFAKGVGAILDGIFNGLFGFLEIFGVKVDGVGGFLRFLGEAASNVGRLLQSGLGEGIGYVLSFFVPLTKTIDFAVLVFKGLFAIIGKVIKPIQQFGKAITDLAEVGFKGLLRGADDAVKPITELADKVFKIFPGLQKLTDFFTKTLPNAIKNSPFGKWVDQYLITPLSNFIKFADRELGALRSLLGIGNLGEGDRDTGSTTTTTTKPYSNSGETNRFNRLRNAANDLEEDPKGGGTGDTPFQKRVKAIVAKLQTTLEEAKERIKNASESFRDAVGLSFGVITNGFSARFSTSKVIAQMKRIKDAVKTFSKDIIELRKKGADAALIDELIGLGPLAGSAAARDLLTSGSLNEFLGLRKDLASSGAAVGAAGNIAITGTSTSGLQNAINGLNKTIAAGKGNTYNISIANPNITPQQIIAEIKAYEKKTGKKVFSN